MNRRACIAAPPVNDFYFTPHRFSALGSIVAADLLRRAGWEISLLLFPTVGARGHTLPRPEWLDHLAPFQLPDERGPLSFFSRYQRFGPSIDRCAEMILERDPTVLFLSLFAFAYADTAIELAREVKRRCARIHIVAAGAGVTVAPWYFAADGSIDELIMGEAEQELSRWLGMERAAEGRNGTVEVALSVREARSRSGSRLHATTMLSRGCPKRCSFCANHLCHGREFRLVPTERVISAFEQLPAARAISVNFEDDNILFARDYFIDILARLRRRFAAARFSAENGLDYQLLNAETVRTLAALGFERFNLSLGTLDPGLTVRTGRPALPERLREALCEIEAQGGAAVTYFICGLPGDTPESIVATLIFLASLPTLSGISLFYPVPGLPGFEDPALFSGRPAGLSAGSAAYPWAGSLSTEQMVTAFRLSRFVNLMAAARTGLDGPARTLFERVGTDRRLLTLSRTAGSTACVRPPGIDAEMERLFFEQAERMIRPASQSRQHAW
ncbi:B12-binding domain-containing radical SAM protein [Salinispira pacifica]